MRDAKGSRFCSTARGSGSIDSSVRRPGPRPNSSVEEATEASDAARCRSPHGSRTSRSTPALETRPPGRRLRSRAPDERAGDRGDHRRQVENLREQARLQQERIDKQRDLDHQGAPPAARAQRARRAGARGIQERSGRDHRARGSPEGDGAPRRSGSRPTRSCGPRSSSPRRSARSARRRATSAVDLERRRVLAILGGNQQILDVRAATRRGARHLRGPGARRARGVPGARGARRSIGSRPSKSPRCAGGPRREAGGLRRADPARRRGPARRAREPAHRGAGPRRGGAHGDPHALRHPAEPDRHAGVHRARPEHPEGDSRPRTWLCRPRKVGATLTVAEEIQVNRDARAGPGAFPSRIDVAKPSKGRSAPSASRRSYAPSAAHWARPHSPTRCACRRKSSARIAGAPRAHRRGAAARRRPARSSRSDAPGRPGRAHARLSKRRPKLTGPPGGPAPWGAWPRARRPSRVRDRLGRAVPSVRTRPGAPSVSAERGAAEAPAPALSIGDLVDEPAAERFADSRQAQPAPRAAGHGEGARRAIPASSSRGKFNKLGISPAEPSGDAVRALLELRKGVPAWPRPGR